MSSPPAPSTNAAPSSRARMVNTISTARWISSFSASPGSPQMPSRTSSPPEPPMQKSPNGSSRTPRSKRFPRWFFGTTKCATPAPATCLLSCNFFSRVTSRKTSARTDPFTFGSMSMTSRKSASELQRSGHFHHEHSDPRIPGKGERRCLPEQRASGAEGEFLHSQLAGAPRDSGCIAAA